MMDSNIELIRAPQNYLSAQACVAMVTKVPLETILEDMGRRLIQTTIVLINEFYKYGYECGLGLVRVGKGWREQIKAKDNQITTYSDYALVKLKCADKSFFGITKSLKWVVLFKNRIYDPIRMEVYDEFTDKALSYLIVWPGLSLRAQNDIK
ncbi:MAG: hypothetical protein ACFFFC_00690 [Candidatus Thorarchaeota archaeon]